MFAGNCWPLTIVQSQSSNRPTLQNRCRNWQLSMKLGNKCASTGLFWVWSSSQSASDSSTPLARCGLYLWMGHRSVSTIQLTSAYLAASPRSSVWEEKLMNPPRVKSSSRKSASTYGNWQPQTQGMFGHFTDSTVIHGRYTKCERGRSFDFHFSNFLPFACQSICSTFSPCGINRSWFDVPCCQRSLWFSHILSWAVICLTTGRLFELGRLTHAPQVGSKILIFDIFGPHAPERLKIQDLTCGGPQSLPILPGVSHPPRPQSWLRLKTAGRFSEDLSYFFSEGLHSKGHISYVCLNEVSLMGYNPVGRLQTCWPSAKLSQPRLGHASM